MKCFLVSKNKYQILFLKFWEDNMVWLDLSIHFILFGDLTFVISLFFNLVFLLTLGCLLKQQGVECEIFEQSDDVTKYGAGISLTSNAQFPLNDLNILEEIKESGCEPLDIVWREPNGKVIRNMSLSDFGHVITINRKDFIKILIKKYSSLGGIINYNNELAEITNKNQTVKYRNGEAKDFKHIIWREEKSICNVAG